MVAGIGTLCAVIFISTVASCGSSPAQPQPRPQQSQNEQREYFLQTYFSEFNGSFYNDFADQVADTPGSEEHTDEDDGHLDLVLFDDDVAEKYASKCLDGSNAGYYIRKAENSSSSKDKWVIYLKGGGLCVEPIDCYERVSQCTLYLPV